MNDFFLAMGNIAFAIAGLVAFLVEYVFPGAREIARKLAEKGTSPGEATMKADKIKRRQRMWFFVPWVVGMALSAAGLLN